MRTKIVLLCMTLVGLASCSSSKDEPVPPEEIDNPGDIYYMNNSVLTPLWYDLTKSYIMFHVDDKEAVLNKMSTMGLNVDESMVSDIGYNGNEDKFIIKTDAFYEMLNYREIRTVNANYETLYQIPEIIYSNPNITDHLNESWARGSILFLYTEKYSELEQAANDYRFKIVAKWDIPEPSTPLWVISCDKYSKGNVYEILDILVNLNITNGEAELLPSFGPAIIPSWFVFDN